MHSALARPVRRRHVFYVSGFDPQGAPHYHRLYRDEAARQAAVSGYRLEVGPRRKVTPVSAAWGLRYAGPDCDGEVVTTYEFARWDDVVRAHWPRHRASVAAMTVAATWTYARAGALWRLLRWTWPGFVAIFAPFLLVVTLAAAALGGLGLAVGVMGEAGPWLPTAGLALWLAALAGLGVWADRRWHMSWLVRTYHFATRQAWGHTPDLEARLDALGARLVEIVRADAADEVLVVGHSLGTSMAVSVVARALAQDPRADWDKASLLTLGHCIPLLSFLPQASDFRSELGRVADALEGRWVDFTAPPDGCCAALVDPVAATADDGTRHPTPKLLSPRFIALFEPDAYGPIRRDKFRCHFQYLMASQRPGDYDYFAITAGPLRLAERYVAHDSITDFRDLRLFGTPR